MRTITEPGIYYDLPAEDYHTQHDWLSWSQMKHLIPPSTPAHFHANRSKPQENKRHFDFGKVVHALVLGDGDKFEVVQALNKSKEPYDANDYVTVSSQRDRDRIYATGNVPILRNELDTAHAMAAKVKAHPSANVLLGDGKPEVSLFWIDKATGVKCRARLDWLPNKEQGRRLIVPDVKTTAGFAAGDEFGKAMAKFAYYGQQEHYRNGIQAVGLDPDPAFLFIVIEKAAPHEVAVNQMSTIDDVKLARATVQHCIRLFAECATNDNWPGHGSGVNNTTLPKWLHYDLEDAIS